MVKKLMHTTVKTGIDPTKTASKRVIQKTAEATGDLIGNKIVDKSISAGKTKIKGKKKKKKKRMKCNKFTYRVKNVNKLLML